MSDEPNKEEVKKENNSLSDYLKPLPKLNLADKLYKVNFKRGPEAHITLKDESVCTSCVDKPCLNVCPFNVFILEDGKTVVNWDSCGEMGACRVVCPYDNINWTYPAGGFGVSYTYG